MIELVPSHPSDFELQIAEPSPLKAGQLSPMIKNVNCPNPNNLHLNSNYPLGLMPLATQIAGHGSEGKIKLLYQF